MIKRYSRNSYGLAWPALPGKVIRANTARLFQASPLTSSCDAVLQIDSLTSNVCGLILPVLEVCRRSAGSATNAFGEPARSLIGENWRFSDFLFRLASFFVNRTGSCCIGSLEYDDIETESQSE